MKYMENKDYYPASDLARILGISRIAVFKKIKKGEIKAVKIGRNFAIPKKEMMTILGDNLTDKQKKVIDSALKKTTAEYSEVLKLLGDA
jgi:excisionase family DNA binding protein